jgi:hypothetical protein
MQIRTISNLLRTQSDNIPSQKESFLAKWSKELELEKPENTVHFVL